MKEQTLYLKDSNDNLQRAENFPIVSMMIGKYVSNIMHIPDDEFDEAFKEIGYPKNKFLDLNDLSKVQNNEAIPVFIDSNTVYVFLRPERFREQDRKDAQAIRELKAKGNLVDKLRDQ